MLLNKNAITAKQLATRFNVSTRTIYRDIEELSLAGIPIYTNKGKGGGISLLNEYTINKALLSEKDKESLIITLNTLKITRNPDVGNLLEKLGCIFKSSNTNDWVIVDFSDWDNTSNAYVKFDNIKNAILKSNLIKFKYINSEGISSFREVEPYKLIFKSNSWYLWAFCLAKKEVRLFKLNRIKELTVDDTIFLKRDLKFNFNNTSYIPMINLKLRFNNNVLYKIYDFYDEECIINNNDGTYDVNVKYPNGEWIIDHILSYGNNVTVLEPDFIRNEIIKRLKYTLKNYEDYNF